MAPIVKPDSKNYTNNSSGSTAKGGAKMSLPQSIALNYHLALLCLSGFLDLFGVSLVIPFLPKSLRVLGESYTAVGFVGSIYGFLQFFSSPVVGNLSDRFGRKQILIISLCCTALSYLMMTTRAFSSSILVVAISRIPPGLLKHSQSLTKAEIAKSTKALSYFNAASTTGFIVGPPLTGFLMDRFAPLDGYAIAGQIAAVAFFVNAVLVYYILTDEKSSASTPSKRSNDPVNSKAGANKQKSGTWLSNGYAGVRRACAPLAAPPLCYIYMAKFLNSQALFMSRSTYLLYLETELKLSSSALGWLSSAAPALTVLFAPLVTPVCARFSQTSPRLQAICCLLEILSVVLLLIAPNAIFVVLSAIPHGFSTAVGRVNYTSMSLFFGGGANVGTLIGFDQSVLSFSRTIAPAVAGLLMDFSLRLPLALSICLLIPTAILFHNLCSFTENKRQNAVYKRQTSEALASAKKND